ncbi:HET-domain-containing protein, partial [Dothidotthia symphoricarpi CBS 119687]
MRLLNTSTLNLHYFGDDIPLYVILSHVWGRGEVTFDDIDKSHAKGMLGYKKIAECCDKAVQDGFEWVWIDTCCIDKKSSAELSEAINSMYRWYWQAEICYAYLKDVAEDEDYVDEKSKFQTSRWFQRGWTLQELLAPTVVEFYGRSWGLLGTKSSLLDAVHAATKIEKKYLVDRDLIKNASVATKFSWASLRRTTRTEDMAYCLLGLVHVNMPMLYGEGERAFFRLQLEIIKQTNEHTIFAWNPNTGDSRPSLGVLAPSPTFFKLSTQISSHDWKKTPSSTYEMTNRGLRMKL